MFAIWTDRNRFFCCCEYVVVVGFDDVLLLFGRFFSFFAHFTFNAFSLIDQQSCYFVLFERTYHNKSTPVHSNRNRMNERKRWSQHTYWSDLWSNCRRILICVFSKWRKKGEIFCYFAYLAIIVASVIYFLPLAQIIEAKSLHFFSFWNFTNVFFLLCFFAMFVFLRVSKM